MEKFCETGMTKNCIGYKVTNKPHTDTHRSTTLFSCYVYLFLKLVKGVHTKTLMFTIQDLQRDGVNKKEKQGNISSQASLDFKGLRVFGN